MKWHEMSKSNILQWLLGGSKIAAHKMDTNINKRIGISLTQTEMRKTMKIISKLLSIAIAILMVGCSLNNRTAKNNNLSIVGSGNVVSQARAVSGFDRVEVGLTFDVTIRQGEDFSVVLYSDDNFIDYMQAEVQGTTLSFGFVPGFAYDLHGVTLRADVTMPELTSLELSGSSHANLDGLRSRGILDIELSGSSFLAGTDGRCLWEQFSRA
jgi:hypothetical protein